MVYIGSLAGKLVTPLMGPYAVAKSALAAYVDAVRLEMAPQGAHVLLVSPGPIRREDADDDATFDRYADEVAAAADVLVAHNAAFDRQWFGREELPPLQRPWLCSMEDIRWPAERHLRATPSVRDLALAYGVPVWAAHRALTDCIYIAQVFEREEQLETLLQQALLPRKLYRARLPYDQRHLAKEAGFRWNEGVQGAWSKRLTEAERGLLPFEVLPAEGDQSPNWPQSA
jgi:hypothetical protein